MTLPFELEILKDATNYQKWAAQAILPYLGERILEVGSGIGNMSQWLPVRQKLVLSETEPHLLEILRSKVDQTFGDHPRIKIEQINLASNWVESLIPHHFDTIVSFNVLEHIEDDAAALAQLQSLLDRSEAPGPKRMVHFVPAHSWAYGTIDRGYGHFRRYSARDFKRIAQKIDFKGRLEFRHFNLTGLPGWFLMNRVLRKKSIGGRAIRTFEKLCPWIRGADDFTHQRLRLPLGQSLIAVMHG